MTLLAKLSGAHRSAASGVALWRVMETSGKSLACISIGGGPTRAHPRLKNLNLELLPNVDIVADAHRLPFRGGSLSAIHCEAVLEHLEYPDLAVGPTVALTDLAFEYLRELGPGPVVRRFLAWGVRLLLFPLRLVDRRANRHPNAHTVASTTFVHGRKSLVRTQGAS